MFVSLCDNVNEHQGWGQSAIQKLEKLEICFSLKYVTINLRMKGSVYILQPSQQEEINPNPA